MKPYSAQCSFSHDHTRSLLHFSLLEVPTSMARPS